MIGNQVSIRELLQNEDAKFLFLYDQLTTYKKGRESFIIGEKPNKKEILVSHLSRYVNGFKSKSNIFIEHTSSLTDGTKIIRCGYVIFLGCELYVKTNGKIYKHNERTGLIDMSFRKGLGFTLRAYEKKPGQIEKLIQWERTQTCIANV